MKKAIGIFDSGVGGLTVMKHLMEVLPHENLVYFGDTARLPYGGKSRETILKYSLENVSFLLEHNIKAVVVACNTATALSLDDLKSAFSLPILGVIDPGVQIAVKTSKNKRIAILATKATIQSQIYTKKIKEMCPEAFVIGIAAPLLVPLVEENYVDHMATQLILEDYLKDIQKNKIDTLLLGCTHYPLLSTLIQKIVGEKVAVLNSAHACALMVKQALHDLNSEIEKPFYRFFVSDDPRKFEAQAKQLLGLNVECLSCSDHLLKVFP